MTGWRKRQVVELAQEAGVISGFDSVHPSIERFAELVRADEREGCAKLCDDVHQGLSTKKVGELIRARGQA
jgi:hypothetical protein